MAVLIDPPMWPAYGRLWSHLASDTSLAELHAFAAAAGIPARGFEGDHYDVPQERYDSTVDAGAAPVSARELLSRLQGSGLRTPKRRGEKVLLSRTDPATGRRTDTVASALLPLGPVLGGYALVRSPDPDEATWLSLLPSGRRFALPALDAPTPPAAARVFGHVRLVEPPARQLSAVLVVVLAEPDAPATLLAGLVRVPAVRAVPLLAAPHAALVRHLVTGAGRRPWPGG